MVAACSAAGFDLIILETPGIGQGDAAVTEIADVSLYVMTPEYGAASQLEKIDMLDMADVVAINKYDRNGAEDALRQVSRQWNRDHRSAAGGPGDEPVYGTVASRFNDEGTTALFHRLKGELTGRGLQVSEGVLPVVADRISERSGGFVPAARRRYLAEIADTIRAYHAQTVVLADEARRVRATECRARAGPDPGSGQRPDRPASHRG